MRTGTRVALAIAVSVVGIMSGVPRDLRAEGPGAAALSGSVGSSQEARMEGVVVSARRDGANFTVSVVSDAQGKYSFPRTHLEPGKYTLTIRAVGYDLTDPGAGGRARRARRPASTSKLEKTKDLASQLSSLEWAMSIPGTTEQKDKLVYQTVSCAYCHTWKRVMKSKHTAEELVAVMTRMQTYYTDGTAVSDDGRGRGQKSMPDRVAAAAKNANWGAPRRPKKELAEYLATVNLSGGRTTWPFELKTLPRPTGKATRVIITQYDMPRPDTVSHDLDLDSKGTVWYTDESRMFFGKMDPKTGKFTEYPLPAVPPGDLPGARDIQVDQDDNIWFPQTDRQRRRCDDQVQPEDRRTEHASRARAAQFMAIGPDGKIWAGLDADRPEDDEGRGDLHLEGLAEPAARDRTACTSISPSIDSKGNPWAPDFRGSHIIGIDAVTRVAKFWPVPTPNSSPRRSRMDAQDRFWFAEYTGDKIGMFDTRTETVPGVADAAASTRRRTPCRLPTGTATSTPRATRPSA